MALVVVIPLMMNSQSKPASPPRNQQTQKRMSLKQTTEDRGGVIFAQNCSRCHNAPEGFSSRISGTIVRHMRVRANLSKKDAETLMQYINP